MNYLNPELCAKCGGQCCKTMPGSMTPDDIKPKLSVQAVAKLLQTGRYCVNWWEGDVKPRGRMSRVMYLRPATKGKEGHLKDASWGGECTFLTATGCSLAPDERPDNCRMLEPKPGGVNCITHSGSKAGAALAWRPHQQMIRRALTNDQSGRRMEGQ